MNYWVRCCCSGLGPLRIAASIAYNADMQRKIFWTVFGLLGLIADLILPFWWAVGATIPIMWLSWWLAYRSEWF
jgi:hypothetical protein